jgi:hypothetical protein
MSWGAKKWAEYRDDFFIRNDPEGILKASFLIGYLCVSIEFTNDTQRMITFNSKNSAHFPILAQQIDTLEGRRNLPGFNWSGAGAMIFKKHLMNKSYDELLNGFLKEVRERTKRLPNVPRIQNVFKYTGYDPKHAIFSNVYFLHSIAMFGWYTGYGYYKNKKGEYVVRDFPGSCNVQALINMYLFKGAGHLDKLVYTAHGRNMVKRDGTINAVHAQRELGEDDVQFCHHGFKLYNTEHDNTSGYVKNHWIKIVRNHVDTFDILTLAPIFRLRQRLIRTKKGHLVTEVDKFIDEIQSNVKTFIKEHRLSNIPSGNVLYKSKNTNVIRKNNSKR